MRHSMGKYRWVVVTLLFFATTINYLDRQVIGLLKDSLAKDFNWSETDYSRIVMAFSSAYAIALVLFGRLIDQIGTRLGYAVSIIIWSVAAMCHALATGTLGFGIARTALGAGEGGNFPAAIKAVAEWFPKKDRALATGIFNSGTNIAAIAGPPLIAWIFSDFGWREAFLWTGALGFIWLIFWWWLYEIPSKQKRVTAAEFDYIHSDADEKLPDSGKKTGWSELFRFRQTWAFVLGKFLTDPVWWFYLFWIPSYFNTTYHLNLTKSAIHVSTVYVVASFGSILGGYLSGWLIKSGMPVYKARKTSMFFFACCVVPIFFVRYTTTIWPAVWLISLAAAAHQAWSANIFTLASDMFPKHTLSSVVGIGGMAGSVGGILFPLLIGILLEHFKLLGLLGTGYNIIFGICAVAYLLAWVIMQVLSPKMEYASQL
ncbi:MAG TPA: MFS transporter [Chitinophagaceae bacterium]|jgi:MFS transporter, ACS family, hexuronate transporter|nr:MFS transporter [Chitinophagaceae bacterium]